eukprot:Rmarinus@m.4040
MASSSPSSFLVMVTGQIEYADFPGENELWCKYSFEAGPDWVTMHGLEEGVSQMSRKGHNPEIVWNFPVDITFRTTNAFGWPQIVVTVYGTDGVGRDYVKGYGAMHIPMAPGRYTLRVKMFAPMSSSPFQEFLSWLQGCRPEFVDRKFVSKGSGRELVRVRSKGVIVVRLDVVTKDMALFGYTEEARGALE